MSLFEDRERAFENLFAHEEDMRFRAAARRNRRLALWASRRMGRSSADTDAYADFLVRLGAYFGDAGVCERLLHDLDAAGSPASQHRIARLMDEWLAEELSTITRPQPGLTSARH
ncbi:MAG: DUF1476 domain-containing protein [Beijerinckiaceae bacterium]|nr:DUF1476 domain-containing protein [Beijerinckiaceae bacterium]